jgi:RimJ/RimL family protein N-acetyltransferase
MFARTDRLLLRPGWREDAPALFTAIADPAIVDKLPDTPWPYRAEDAEAYLFAERPADALPELLIHARTFGRPRLVGGIALRDAGKGTAELDYWIARKFWGLGFATEAGRAMVNIARDALRLTRLRSSHFTDNPASGRVLEKLGFRATGAIERRYSRVRDAEVDCVMYEIAA